MLIHPTVERLRSLGLAAMADTLVELQNNPEAAEMSHVDWLGLLIDREATFRDNRRLSRRLTAAKLRQTEKTTFAARLGEVGKEARRSFIEDGETVAAGFVAEGASQSGLPCSGCASLPRMRLTCSSMPLYRMRPMARWARPAGTAIRPQSGGRVPIPTPSQACEPLQPAEHAKTRGQSPPQSALVLLQVTAGSGRAINVDCSIRLLGRRPRQIVLGGHEI